MPNRPHTVPIQIVSHNPFTRGLFLTILKSDTNKLCQFYINEAELLEIEQDLDTEDFLLEDLYELSGTEESEILADIDFEKSMTEIYMEEILGSDSF